VLPLGFVGGTNSSSLDYNFFRKNLETASSAGRQARNAGQARKQARTAGT